MQTARMGLTRKLNEAQHFKYWNISISTIHHHLLVVVQNNGFVEQTSIQDKAMPRKGLAPFAWL